MSEEVLRMKEDLRAKLYRLFSIFDQPALFLADYFYNLRNEIDIDAEELLKGKHERKIEWNESLASVNPIRIKFIGFLKMLEDNCLDKVRCEKQTMRSNEAYSSLKQKIDDFMSHQERSISEMEVEYEHLALELIDETNSLIKKLLKGQTIAFLPSDKKNKQGTLICLTDDFLNQEEVDCLK